MGGTIPWDGPSAIVPASAVEVLHLFKQYYNHVPLIKCGDCGLLDTMGCPVKRTVVHDGVEESACVAPGGFCAWAKPKEE